MSSGKLGRIVWHDLFTADEHASKQFYERVAGWTYVTEHATNFAWGGGEKDFVLALSCNEAGAGFVGGSSEPISGWLPYIEVQDVDATAAAAARIGGSVARPPFEVAGVGRNCLLCDPLGAHFGITFSRHDFPAPTQQFGPERYVSGDKDFPIGFYNQLFGWDMIDTGHIVITGPATAASESTIAYCTVDTVGRDEVLGWLPGIRVTCLKAAMTEVEAAGGEALSLVVQGFDRSAAALINDPQCALAYLVEG